MVLQHVPYYKMTSKRIEIALSPFRSVESQACTYGSGLATEFEGYLAKPSPDTISVRLSSVKKEKKWGKVCHALRVRRLRQISWLFLFPGFQDCTVIFWDSFEMFTVPYTLASPSVFFSWLPLPSVSCRPPRVSAPATTATPRFGGLLRDPCVSLCTVPSITRAMILRGDKARL